MLAEESEAVGEEWKEKVESKASDDRWELFAAQLEGGREEAVKQLNVNLH